MRAIYELLASESYIAIDGTGIITKAEYSKTYYILVPCIDELVLINLDEMTILDSLDRSAENLFKVLKYSDIEEIQLEKGILDYKLNITSDGEKYNFIVQDSALSDFRMSGYYAGILSDSLKMVNWHSANIDRTIQFLKDIGDESNEK